MSSIREQLNIALIILLITISLVFVSIIFALYFTAFNLSPETLAQIISALATTIAVILTLSLRFIDDALKRYEKFVKPRIHFLLSILTSSTSGDIKSLIQDYSPNLGNICSEMSKTANSITKHGNFFLKALYPKQALDRIPESIKNIEEYGSVINDLKELTNFTSDYVLKEFIKMFVEGTEVSDKWAHLQIEARSHINKQKPQLASQLKESRKKILQEIDLLTNELQSFLDEND